MSWSAPLVNTDGSQLTDLAGFEIRYGQNANALDQNVTISNNTVDSYVIDNLSSGTWFFSVTARNAQGVISVPSATVSKVIT